MFINPQEGKGSFTFSFAYHASGWRLALTSWVRAGLDQEGAASVSGEIKRLACLTMSCNRPRRLYSHLLLFMHIHECEEHAWAEFRPIKLPLIQFCLNAKKKQSSQLKGCNCSSYPSSGLVSDIGPPSAKVPFLLFKSSRFSWLWLPAKTNKQKKKSHSWLTLVKEIRQIFTPVGLNIDLDYRSMAWCQQP